MRGATEAAEMAAYFDWVRIQANQNENYETIIHIPNGGMRHIVVAFQLKRGGVTPGVWDVLIACPRGGHAGVWIEFKMPSNGLTKDQKRWGELMRKRGYRLHVAYSADDAIEYTKKYLGR